MTADTLAYRYALIVTVCGSLTLALVPVWSLLLRH